MRKRRRLFAVIPILAVAILIFFSTESGLFSIKRVEVDAKDAGCSDNPQLINASGILGQSFWLINSGNVTKTLQKKFFCIKSVNLSKYFPDKVKLQILGRQPQAILVDLKNKEDLPDSIENIATPSAFKAQGKYLVDDEGMVFAEDKGNFNLPYIYVNSEISLGNKSTDMVLNSLKILDEIKGLGVVIKEGIISGEYLIVYESLGNRKIIFQLRGGIDIQLASLQLILDKAKIYLQEWEFIDLRFDKPIVRFAPKK